MYSYEMCYKMWPFECLTEKHVFRRYKIMISVKNKRVSENKGCPKTLGNYGSYKHVQLQNVL